MLFSALNGSRRRSKNMVFDWWPLEGAAVGSLFSYFCFDLFTNLRMFVNKYNRPTAKLIFIFIFCSIENDFFLNFISLNTLMNVDEVREVCKDRSVWRDVVAGYSNWGKGVLLCMHRCIKKIIGFRLLSRKGVVVIKAGNPDLDRTCFILMKFSAILWTSPGYLSIHVVDHNNIQNQTSVSVRPRPKSAR